MNLLLKLTIWKLLFRKLWLLTYCLFSFSENVIKYEAPRGEVREPDIDLEDISYDGTLDGKMMRGGLGQLVDGLYGDDDYQKQLNGEQSGTK